MRKAEREVTQFNDIIEIIDKCDTVRMAIACQPYPYIVPLSFGYEIGNEMLYVYFHCATEGRKVQLIQKTTEFVSNGIPLTVTGGPNFRLQPITRALLRQEPLKNAKAKKN